MNIFKVDSKIITLFFVILKEENKLMEDFPISNQKELIYLFEEEEFAKKVLVQIQKEFLKVGIQLEFSANDLSTYGHFTKKLAQEIHLLFESSSQRFQQLLYVSDLPENLVKNILREAKDPALQLGYVLALRIAQKIFFREQYKKGKL